MGNTLGFDIANERNKCKMLVYYYKHWKNNQEFTCYTHAISSIYHTNKYLNKRNNEITKLMK